MARLRTVGFETLGSHPALDGNLMTTNATFSAERSRSGDYAIKVDSSTQGNSQMGVFMTQAQTSGVSHFFRFYVRFAHYPDATATVFRNRNFGASQSICLLKLTPAGKLEVWEGPWDAGFSKIGEWTPTVQLNEWIQVEVRTLWASAANEQIEVRVNGTAVVTGYAREFLTAAPNRYEIGWLDSPGSNKVMYVDDVAINDDTGTFQNSWPGDGRVGLIRAAEDVARATGWVAGAGGTTLLWRGVDNVFPLGSNTPTNVSQIKNAASTTTENYDTRLDPYATSGLTGGTGSFAVDTSLVPAGVGSAGNAEGFATRFKARHTNVTSVRILLYKTGTPTGNISLSIRGLRSLDGLPDDSNVLATASVSEASVVNGTWVTFTLNYNGLIEGENYWICVLRDSGASANFLSIGMTGDRFNVGTGALRNSGGWGAESRCFAFQLTSNRNDAPTLVHPFVSHAEQITTGTKTVGFAGVSGPAISEITFSAGDDSATTMAVWPTGWAVRFGTATTMASISDYNTQPVLRVGKRTATTREIHVDMIGAYVEYVSTSAQLRYALDTVTAADAALLTATPAAEDTPTRNDLAVQSIFGQTTELKFASEFGSKSDAATQANARLETFATGLPVDLQVVGTAAWDGTLGNPAGSIRTEGSGASAFWFTGDRFKVNGDFSIRYDIFFPSGQTREIFNFAFYLNYSGATPAQNLSSFNGFAFRLQTEAIDGGLFIITNGVHSAVNAGVGLLPTNAWYRVEITVTGFNLNTKTYRLSDGVIFDERNYDLTNLIDSTHPRSGTFGQKPDGAGGALGTRIDNIELTYVQSSDTSVTASEPGSKSDLAQVSYSASAAETGSRSDSAFVSVAQSSAEVGSQTDEASLSAGVSAADSPSRADVATLQSSAFATETGSRTDLSTLAASVSSFEAATATDAASASVLVVASDVLVGVDAAAVTSLQHSAAETGSRSDQASSSATLSAADVLVGSDGATASAQTSATEAYVGTPDQALALAGVSAAEVASWSDVGATSAALAAGEVGVPAGADRTYLEVTLSAAEVAAGAADGASSVALLASAELGAPTDAGSLSAALFASEIASRSDSATAGATAASVELALATDASVVAAAALANDHMSGTDAHQAQNLGSTDKNAIEVFTAEDQAAISAFPEAAQSGAGSDQAFVQVPRSATEAGAGSDQATVAVNLVSEETGRANDAHQAVNLGSNEKVAADSPSPKENTFIAVEVFASETASALDQAGPLPIALVAAQTRTEGGLDQGGDQASLVARPAAQESGSALDLTYLDVAALSTELFGASGALDSAAALAHLAAAEFAESRGGDEASLTANPTALEGGTKTDAAYFEEDVRELSAHEPFVGSDQANLVVIGEVGEPPGAGSDDAVLTALTYAADVAEGSDASAVNATATSAEAGSRSDAASLVAHVAEHESASAADEAVSIVPKEASEIGGLTDQGSASATLVAHVAASEEDGGQDAAVGEAHLLAQDFASREDADHLTVLALAGEPGAGSDEARLAFVEAYAVETPTATDMTTAAAFVEAHLTAGVVGSPRDADQAQDLGSNEKLAIQSGEGDEAAVAVALTLASESASATDEAVAEVPLAADELASALDAASAVVEISANETGPGTDSAELFASPVARETSGFADEASLSSVRATAFEPGSKTDQARADVSFVSAETATPHDAAEAVANLLSQDGGHYSDASVAFATLSAQDPISATEEATLFARVAAGEVGAPADFASAVNLGTNEKAASEHLTPRDEANVATHLVASESGSYAELAQATASLSAAEIGGPRDSNQAVDLGSNEKSSIDVASGLDQARAQAYASAQETASATDGARLSALPVASEEGDPREATFLSTFAVAAERPAPQDGASVLVLVSVGERAVGSDSCFATAQNSASEPGSARDQTFLVVRALSAEIANYAEDAYVRQAVLAADVATATDDAVRTSYAPPRNLTWRLGPPRTAPLFGGPGVRRSLGAPATRDRFGSPSLRNSYGSPQHENDSMPSSGHGQEFEPPTTE